MLKTEGTPAISEMSTTKGTPKIAETPGRDRRSTRAGSQQAQKRHQQQKRKQQQKREQQHLLNTAGKSATSGRQATAGVVDTGGKFASGGKSPFHLNICHRCQRHRLCEYLRKFSKFFKTKLLVLSRGWGRFMKKKLEAKNH